MADVCTSCICTPCLVRSNTVIVYAIRLLFYASAHVHQPQLCGIDGIARHVNGELALIAFIAGGGSKPRLIAKLSSLHCCNGPTKASAHISSLSTEAVSKVSAAAAAVGLSYHSDIPVPCWVLLNPAETEEATAAAVQALLAPIVSVMSGKAPCATRLLLTLLHNPGIHCSM